MYTNIEAEQQSEAATIITVLLVLAIVPAQKETITIISIILLKWRKK